MRLFALLKANNLFTLTAVSVILYKMLDLRLLAMKEKRGFHGPHTDNRGR